MFNLETTKPKGCPICNQTMIRPVAVYVVCGNIVYTITSKGCEQENCIETYSRGGRPAENIILSPDYLAQKAQKAQKSRNE